MEENTEARKKRRLTGNQIWLCILIFVILLAFASPFSYSVRGRVTDDETGKPVEGAVFAIRWYRCPNMFFGIQIGDGSVCDDIGKAEGFTDAEGNFAVLKYTGSLIPPPPRFEMAVYKKGYVMWNNDTIMYPERYEEIEAGKRKPEELFENIKWKLENGMILRMRPWKEDYSFGRQRARHAVVACGVASLTVKSRLLEDALGSECELTKTKWW